MHNSDDFSKNFAALLKQSCLSQLEIAEKSGIHKQSINRYVTGKTLPGYAELEKLADALGCSLDSFRSGVFIEPREVVAEDEERLRKMKPIIKELGSLVGTLTTYISE